MREVNADASVLECARIEKGEAPSLSPAKLAKAIFAEHGSLKLRKIFETKIQGGAAEIGWQGGSHAVLKEPLHQF
jgi:hypothetical protein